MINPWSNITIRVQRRPISTTNSLNEPDYGDEANYPIVYDNVLARYEAVEHTLQFNEQGERVEEVNTTLMVEPEIQLLPMDRITCLTSDDPQMVNKLYILQDVHTRWDAIGNVHHYVGEIQVH
jgi:hypothetical protein